MNECNKTVTKTDVRSLNKVCRFQFDVYRTERKWSFAPSNMSRLPLCMTSMLCLSKRVGYRAGTGCRQLSSVCRRSASDVVYL